MSIEKETPPMFGPKKKPDDPATSSPSPSLSGGGGATATLSPPGARKPGEDVRPGQGPGPVRTATDELRSPRSNPLPSAFDGAAAQGMRGSSRSTRPGAPTSSIMNPHLSFEGSLKYSGTLTIDCEFRGSVSTEDTIIVGSSGKLEAEVSAGVVEISGRVRGNIKARTRVKIHTGGEVYGNIETPTISMDEGVVFEGNCARPAGTPPPPKSKAAEGEKGLEHAAQPASPAAA